MRSEERDLCTAMRASLIDAQEKAVYVQEMAAAEAQEMAAAKAETAASYNRLQADKAHLDLLIDGDGCRRCEILRDGRCQYRSLVRGMLHANPRSVTFNGCDGLRTEICKWLSEHKNEPSCDGGLTWLQYVSVYLVERKKVNNDRRA